jgi:replicative DNA helicase
LETENGIVTDAEIDNLLKQAEREILREHLYNETTRIVDANALLQDVEDDLEQSFRTKVFEGLKSSYKTVLTAVTERNN